jgi:RNA polymerase sigma factor (sigma-70 family)
MNRAIEKTRLRQFIAEETDGLLGTLRYYVFRAGLTGQEQPLDAAASELLNEVVIEALEHEDKFRPSGQPRAWLLGIAANLIKRKQVEVARRSRREPLARDLYPGDQDALSDDDLFDWMASLTGARAALELENDEQVNAMMAGVSPDDQRVLRLAILHGLDGEALAAALGCNPGAARVRLHRALNRLRTSYLARKEVGDE